MPSYDRGYGGLSSGKNYGALYDMGTGKNYSSGTSYGAYSGFKPSSSTYSRSYSYDPPKYTPSSSVVDKIKKFTSMEPKYSHTDYRYPSLDRSTTGRDRYSSLDRYSTRSGYTSDYGGGGGGGGGGGTPYGSWDRASSRSNRSYGGSREGSPVSTRSSRYDYSSSASPYSTYSSYKSGSDASPVPKRPYERQSSRGYEAPPGDYSTRRTSLDSRYVAPPPPTAQPTPSHRRKSLSDESDDSAPEAEKHEPAIRYLICRGTSPPPDPEVPKRENKAKERISVSRTRRIKVPERASDKRSRRQTVIEKGPALTDCATQTNLDQPQGRRSRLSSSGGFGGGGGGGSGTDRGGEKGGGGKPGSSSSQPGETFYKYRDKFIGGSAPNGSYSAGGSSSAGVSRNSSRSTLKDSDSRRSYKDEAVSSPPAERSWRQAVYGDPPPASASRPSSRRSGGQPDDDMSVSSSKQPDDDDDMSSRHSRRRRDPRTSTPSTTTAATPPHDEYASTADEKRSRRGGKAPSRSSSREDVLEDRPRRKRRCSKELLDEERDREGKPLTSENISLRDSIEKVNQWRQKLPADAEAGITRSDSYEYVSGTEHVTPHRDSAYSRNSRHDTPPHSRDNSPSRRSHRHGGGSRKHGSRSASNDSLLDAADDPHASHLPNKDFRKSDLNRANYYDHESDVFDREPSPEVRRPRGHRRNDSYGKDPQGGGQRIKRSGSSSDQAFSRDESPNRVRHGSRQSAQEGHRLKRENSRDSVLDDRRRSRRDDSDDNRDESPSSRHRKHGRPCRQSSREDILDDRSSNASRLSSGDHRKRPNQLGLDKPYDDDSKHKLQQSVSQHSLASATSTGTLPDLVTDAGLQNPQQHTKQQQQYTGTKSGYIGRVYDIDNLLEEERHRPQFGPHILDAPVPRTSHHPLKPSPVQSQAPRPNSYAFENAEQRPAGTVRPSKSLGDKLVDIDDDKLQPHKARSTAAAPPPATSDGQRKKVQLSPTAQQMWAILQAKKGLVTISDFLALCEKPSKRKLIQVGGAEEEDRSYQPFSTANEMLDYLGVDVQKLEDCALQIYRYHSGSQGDYGSYLDLESSLDEQAEELEGFTDQRKNTLILRTQLTVRVHAIIEKLLNSSGKELRRALFSLKQIFQDDKDLVHEFVNNDGLDCLIKVGAEADQNYQNYILRALGQVMLYVDGMEGVIRHNATIQWLYTLLASKGRLVVKTALKLLLVFIEYTETNAMQLLRAINTVDARRGLRPWANVMAILSEKDGSDSELLVYAMTLVNKVLNAIPEQDSFYDVTDTLEEQGMERITRKHMERQGADLDLLTQLQIYESALKHEDGEDSSEIPQLENLRREPRLKSEGEGRKSKRHVPLQKAGLTPSIPIQPPEESPADMFKRRRQKQMETGNFRTPEQQDTEPHAPHKRHPVPAEMQQNGSPSSNHGMRDRRERRHRHCSLIKEQELASEFYLQLDADAAAENCSITSTSSSPYGTLSSASPDSQQSGLFSPTQRIAPFSSLSSQSDLEFSEGFGHGKGVAQYNESGYHSFAEASLDPSSFEARNNALNDQHSPTTGSHADDDGSAMSSNQRWAQYKRQQHQQQAGLHQGRAEEVFEPPPLQNQWEQPVAVTEMPQRRDQYIEEVSSKQEPGRRQLQKERLNNEGSVQEARNRFTTKDDKGRVLIQMVRPAGDTSGIISAAKEGLSRSSKPDAPRELPPPPPPESEKKTESDMQWERIQRRLKRSLKIKDMDFTDLKEEEDQDVFSPPKLTCEMAGMLGDLPPPPPPPGMAGLPPPPPPPGMGPPPPPAIGLFPPPPPSSGMTACSPSSNLPPPLGANLPKKKKTVKLHWRPLQTVESPHPATKGDVVWKDLLPFKIDVEKMEHLFENRTNEVKAKKQDASGKKEITVLDTKRSNAINIGLTVLPPPRTIKSAILKMDTSIMNKEGIEKILQTMIPTEEEKTKILEAQMANPDIPLGTAEQFLLTLSSVFELEARLHLWLFKLDYETLEQEVAEPLMDLKKGIEILLSSKTFKCILSAVLAIGNFLNGASARAFSIDFLQRVPEVKDTVHKHSLLYHMCNMILEQFPDTSDFYSDIGSITRCSRIDWEELMRKLDKMEYDCKASWDHLRAILKHDGSSTDLKGKMSLFLADAAERIMLLQIIYRRIINRYHKLLLYMGLPMHEAKEMRINHFCKGISEFALEYRTTRDKVLHMMEKKANQRERKKTRGKMIVETENFAKSGAKDDDQLHNLLKNGYASADERGFPGQKSRRKLDARSLGSSRGGLTTDSEMYDTGDDEILEACVRTAAAPINKPRERRRSRNQRKSLRRTLKSGLEPDEVTVTKAYADHV